MEGAESIRHSGASSRSYARPPSQATEFEATKSMRSKQSGASVGSVKTVKPVPWWVHTRLAQYWTKYVAWLWETDTDKIRETWHPFRQNCARLLEFNVSGVAIFDIFIIVAIVVNVLIFILEIDYKAACIDEEKKAEVSCAPAWAEIPNIVFILIYTSELITRVFVHRLKFFVHPSGLLDLFIVLSAYIALLGETVADARKLQFFRLARVFRIVRMARIITHFPTLHTLIRGFGGCVAAMFWGVVLMLLMIVMWAMITVEMFWPTARHLFNDDQQEYCKNAFSSVLEASLMLFQTMVAGDAWSECAIPLITQEPVSFLIFAAVLVTLQLGFTNLVLAIIVDNASKATHADQQDALEEHLEEKKRSVDKWHHMVKTLDTNNDKQLDLKELLAGKDQQEAQELFGLMDMDDQGLEEMFGYCDLDDNGFIQSEDIVEAFYKAHTQDSRIYLMVMKMQLTKMRADMLAEFQDLASDNNMQFHDLRVALNFDGVADAGSSKYGKRNALRRHRPSLRPRKRGGHKSQEEQNGGADGSAPAGGMGDGLQPVAAATTDRLSNSMKVSLTTAIQEEASGRVQFLADVPGGSPQHEAPATPDMSEVSELLRRQHQRLNRCAAAAAAAQKEFLELKRLVGESTKADVATQQQDTEAAALDKKVTETEGLQRSPPNSWGLCAAHPAGCGLASCEEVRTSGPSHSSPGKEQLPVVSLDRGFDGRVQEIEQDHLEAADMEAYLQQLENSKSQAKTEADSSKFGDDSINI